MLRVYRCPLAIDSWKVYGAKFEIIASLMKIRKNWNSNQLTLSFFRQEEDYSADGPRSLHFMLYVTTVRSSRTVVQYLTHKIDHFHSHLQSQLPTYTLQMHL